MRRLLSVGLAVTLAGCAGSRVAPTAPMTINLNSEVSGRLTSRDARLNDRSLYQAWSFYATQGTNVQIDLMSSDFDAFLILQGPAGSEIARNDDGGEGMNARLNLSLPATGMYRIIANAYRRDQSGRYRLRLSSSGGSVPPVPSGPVVTPPPTGGGGVMAGTVGQVLRGQTVQGRLTTGDARLQDGTYYQAWTYYGQAGEVITLDVNSSDFDAYAVIQDMNGSALARDDDSGGNLNARITFTLPYTGNFRLIANTVRQGAVGAYVLSVR